MTELSFFGENARFHHVGLAVRSIRDLCPDGEIFTEKVQSVFAAFVNLNGVRVELLEPDGDASPIARSLRQGVKLLHLCYEVPNLEEALERCRPAGFHRLRKPIPTPMYDDRRVVWVFSKEYGLIELLEMEPADAARVTQQT